MNHWHNAPIRKAGPMSLRVSISFTNDNPDTIWNRLADRLGRAPTNAEARAEVLRILREGRVDAASKVS